MLSQLAGRLIDFKAFGLIRLASPQIRQQILLKLSFISHTPTKSMGIPRRSLGLLCHRWECLFCYNTCFPRQNASAVLSFY